MGKAARDKLWRPCSRCLERYELLEQVITEWSRDLTKYESKMAKREGDLYRQVAVLEMKLKAERKKNDANSRLYVRQKFSKSGLRR
jgi:hypothetical protein